VRLLKDEMFEVVDVIPLIDEVRLPFSAISRILMSKSSFFASQYLIKAKKSGL
jgi:hypothetical protein